MTRTNETQNFLEQYSKDIIDSDVFNKLEKELTQNDQIYSDLNEELDKLTIEPEPDLSQTFKDIQKNVKNIEKIYTSFLNKYDLNDLTQIAIQCLNKKLPWIEVRKQICKNAVKEFLKQVELNEATRIFNILTKSAFSLENFVKSIIPLKSKTPNKSFLVDEFLKQIENQVDIESFCDVLSLQFEGFNKLINIENFFSNDFNKFSTKFLEPPTFEFPDNLPTVDFLDNIQEQTQKSVENLVVNFLVQTVSFILQQVIRNECLEEDKFLISGTLNDKEIRKQLSIKFGNNGDRLADFVNTASSILSANEFCSLLKGNTSTKAFELLKSVLEMKYFDLKNILKDEESILDLFGILSNSIELDICEGILTSRGEFGPCFDNDVEELRKCLLKKQDIQEKKVNELLKSISDKQKQTLEKLFEILQRDSNEEITYTNLCRTQTQVELLKNLQTSFQNNAQKVLDSIFTTVGITFDQAVNTFVYRLLKDVDVPEKKIQKELPNLTKKVLDSVRKDYNSVFSNTTNEFVDEFGNLKEIIENSLKGNKELEKYIDPNKAKDLHTSGKISVNKRKKVQPELQRKLHDGDFIKNINNVFTLELPPKEFTKANELFKNKPYGTVLPQNSKELFQIVTYAEKDMNNNVVETCLSEYSSVEERVKLESFDEIDKNCDIYKVYLPISFGLATYKPLYKSGINNSEPLFPDYESSLKTFYSQIVPFDGAIKVLFKSLESVRSLISNSGVNLLEFLKEKLLDKDVERFYPHGLSNLSKIQDIPLGINRKTSEYEAFIELYDPFGVRSKITESQYKLFSPYLELHWLLNVWNNMRICYYYKIYPNNEAYLIKIDMNERIPSPVREDVRYGGKFMNIEDWVSYNTLDIGQKDWRKWNLHANIPQINKNVNPFAHFAGLSTPISNAHQSKMKNAKISKGVIEFQYGIPANEKARRNSWNKNNRISKKVDIFDKNSLLPTYFGDYVDINSSGLDKPQAIKGLSEKIMSINSNISEQNGIVDLIKKSNSFEFVFNTKTGKLLIQKSAIPKDPSVSLENTITNVLDLSNNPLKKLAGQGKSYFPGKLSRENKKIFSVPRNVEEYTSVLKKNVNELTNSESYIGYMNKSRTNTEKPSMWKTLKTNELDPQKYSNKSLSPYVVSENVYAFIWANFIINKLKLIIPNLSAQDQQEIRKYYVNNNGFYNVVNGLIKKFSKYVSTSPIFRSFESTKQTEGVTVNDREDGKYDGLIESNILELVNFTPKFKTKLPNCDVDLDLIRLSEIRRTVLNKYKQVMECLDEKDNLKQSLNSAILTSIVKLMIRIYTIELVLGSIFFFSRFDLNLNEIDDILVKFVSNRIINEIKSESERINQPDLINNFFETVGALYLDETKQNSEENIDCENSLDLLILKEIKLTSSRLKKLLYSSNEIKIRDFEINKIFQNQLSPYIDLPLNDVEYMNTNGRFIPTDSSKFTDLQRRDFERSFVGFDKLEERQKKYDIVNNGFYFEKYVKPTYKTKPSDDVLNGIVGISAFNNWLNSNFYSQTKNKRLNEIFDNLKVGMRLMYRPVGDEKATLFRVLNKNNINKLRKLTKDYYEPGTVQSLPNFYLMKQVINTKWKESINVFPMKIELFWKVSSESDVQRIRSMIETDTWDEKLLTSENEKNNKIHITINGTGTRSVFNGSFEEFKKSRNNIPTTIQQFIKESYLEFGGNENINDFKRGSISPPYPPPTQFQQRQIVGDSVLIPVELYEENISLETTLSEFSTLVETTSQRLDENNDINNCDNEFKLIETVKTNRVFDFEKIYDECFEEKFKRKITGSKNYKLLFDNLFSLKKIGAILALYILFYNRNTTSVLDMFNGVKNNLFSFIENVENIDNVNYTDSKILEFGGDSGLFSNNFNINVNNKGSRLFDIDSIRNSTPYIMLKGLMETFDPNIAPSKKITDVANNYKKDIIKSAQPYLELIRRRDNGESLSVSEIDEITATQWLIELAKELEKAPDLPVHIPSVFLMISGLIPTPLGFAYLGFETLLGSDLLEKIENNLKLKEKIELETGISLDAAKEFVKSIEENCLKD